MTFFYRPLTARSPGDAHRASTPLELLFDLVSVIAIAAAAVGLHHGIAEAHTAEAVITFLMAFFAIWWAWMNFTWFSSAYDNDDGLFRLLTMLIMAGSLVMAAGIGSLFKSGDLTMVVVGYVVMRLGMVALWVRAARHDLQRRATAITYALGISLVQVFWVALLLFQPLEPVFVYGAFVLGAALELAVPAIAERKAATTWHRHHIIERYGLLTIIVLGETLLAGAMSLQQVASGMTDIAFVHIALSSLVIVFSMWWLYFSREEHLQTNDLNRALTWGYGHFVIFAAGAAVGAGFAVLVDVIAGHAKVSLLVGDYAVGIPVAIYMLGLWFVRDRFCLNGSAKFVLPVFALLVLLAPLTPVALEGIAAVTALSVVVRNYMVRS
ncbi:low temperature requirement protein LtrA [Hoeflea marina]|uniref:Low temperature requirement protein LtrA n=1 Tax=Hoeflea marina TaxID=274592 RepID=A0A317PHA8_9HYPH|nr:low temperature requirement protein A [Hoeflea marina]PWV98770.1 low temperature requirement protein LtrA [Hoeflea marina]